MSTYTIPEKSLVLAMGPAGSGKSTRCAELFPAGAIVSSDVCRTMVADDPTVQAYNQQAFDLFHTWIGARLAAGRFTVADATNLNPKSRATLREIAAKHGAAVYVLDVQTDLATCLAQNRARDRFVPEHVIEKHDRQVANARLALASEGYAGVIPAPAGVPIKVVVQTGVRVAEAPGFDVLGDVHGCADELTELIQTLGYTIGPVPGQPEGVSYAHPEGRKLVFVGDLTDRGPKNVETLRIAKLALEGGHHAVLGNHDSKLYRALKGNKVKVGHGLAGTLAELETISESERETVKAMLAGLPYQLRLRMPNHPEVIVCHAGIPKRMVGQDTSEARNHAIFGEVLGFEENGMPIRGAGYANSWVMCQEESWLVHGHTVTDLTMPFLYNQVLNLDTGCVFGGRLTAVRFPEFEFVHVAAKATYAVR